MEKSMQDVAQQPEPSAASTVVEKKRIPGWAAGVGVGVFLLTAGAFIYWFLGGTFAGTSDLISDPTRAEQRSGRGGWRQQANADGVKAMQNGAGHYVMAGGVFMDVIPPPQGKKRDVRYQFRYDSRTLLTPEQWHLASGLRQVGQSEQWAKTLDVSREQLDRLRRYGYVPMELSKADEARLIAAWEEYDKATAKGEPEKKLVAMLKEVGAKSLAATKVRANERVAEISRVLTPEQVREMTKLGAGEKVTPITPRGKGATTQPTAKRAATTRPV